MTFPGDQPVSSGQGYTVTEVDGHRPTDLTVFIGTSAITLCSGTATVVAW